MEISLAIDSMQSLNTSDFIALSSAIVALCALGTAIWQGYVTRQHNVLSVRPHLEIVVTSNDTRGISIDVKNGGLGPAIILCIDVTVRGKTHRIKSSSDYQEIFAGLIRMAQISSSFKLHCYMPDKHSVIASGASIELVSLSPTQDLAPLLEVFPQFGGTVSVNVEYQDMYEGKYQINLPSLTGDVEPTAA